MKALLYLTRLLVLATLWYLLLALAPAMARNVVYQGETTPFAVEEVSGYSYEWELYSDGTVNLATVPGNCPKTSAEFVGGNIGASVKVKWIEPGIYYFKLTIWNVTGCGKNIRIGEMEVLSSIPTAVILPPDPEGICAGETALLEVVFTGTGPWDLTYTNGTNSVTVTGITDSNYLLSVSPEITTQYWVTEVRDQHGTNTETSEKVLLHIDPLPVTSQIFPMAIPEKVCLGSEQRYGVTGTQGSIYTWKVNGEEQSTTTESIAINWTSAGEFQLEVQEHGIRCDGEVQTGLINVYEHPEVFAGNPIISCSGSEVELTEATAINFGKLLWTSTGDGTFDDATSLHTVYTPGLADLESGEVSLTLTAEGLGNSPTCIPAVSSLKLNILNIEAIASATNITCYAANDGTITIDGSRGGSGNYEYTINGIDWTSSVNYSKLEPGNYSVQMRDRIMPGCTLNLGDFTITEPDPLSASTQFKNASCLGNDGSITILNPQGGSGSYEFSIGENWTNGYFSGLESGNYTVQIRDANFPECKTDLGSIDIIKPDELSAVVSVTDVSCFGNNNGSISISDTENGSGDYEFSIDGISWMVQNDLPFNQLSAGNYEVLMRDLNEKSCEVKLANAVIKEPDKLTAGISSNMIRCFGGHDGSISILSPMGGSGNYAFTIDGIIWQESLYFTQLIAGKYSVRMREFNHPDCVGLISELELTEPKQLQATVKKTDISCFGFNDGSISITEPKNGKPDYEFTIDGINWTNQVLFTGLSPDTFDVQMRDANSCIQDLGIFVVIEPDPLTATVNSTNVTCLGNDGTITITNPLNGSGFYEYSIDGTNWKTDADFTELDANTYQVQIRDAKLTTCERTIKTITITDTELLSATIGLTHVTCFGGNDGEIRISEQKGGSGIYELSIDSKEWQSATSFTTLKVGSYTIQMRDARAEKCIVTLGAFDLVQPDILGATVVPSHVSCFKGDDGALTFDSPKGGSGKYEYSINGIDWFQEKIENLKIGIYTVQIRDAEAPDCMITLAPVEIKQPDMIVAAIDHTDVTCFGGSDGTIKITKPLNGTAPYQYSLDGGISWQLDSTFTGLTAKTYDLLIIQDVNECSAKLQTIEITQPTMLEATVTSTNETSPAAGNGIIFVSELSGGSSDFEYSIDGNIWQVSPEFNSLSPGNYTLQIRDGQSNDCAISRSVSILPAGSIQATYSYTNIPCYNGHDGSIIFSEASGATNYEYSIDGGTTWQSSAYFFGLTAQNYILMVRDADIPANSSVVGNIKLNQPAVMNASCTVVNETYIGAGDAIITVSSVKGGSGEYLFSIDEVNWISSPVFAGLPSGIYTIWVQDMNAVDCKISIQKIIQPAGSLSADVETTNVSCNGKNDGSIVFSNASGATEFEYSVDAGETWNSASNFTGLPAGNYHPVLRDKDTPANKFELGEIILIEPVELKALISSIPPLCAGTSGSVTITATGGTGTITGTGRFDMAAGESRNFMVSDENGCSQVLPVTMPAPDKIVATKVEHLPKCWDDNGAVSISATGGTGIYVGAETYTVLPGKSYSFKVTDSNGCVSNLVSGTMAAAPSKLEVILVSSGPACLGSTGSLTAVVSGGMGLYFYQWDDPEKQTTKTASGLAPGVYSVTVTDESRCTPVSALALIQEPEAIAIDAKVTVQPSCLQPDGTIEITEPLGDQFEYSSDGVIYRKSPVFAELVPGNYPVSVRDTATGCESKTLVLTVNTIPPIPEVLLVEVSAQPNCLVQSGTIEVLSPIGTDFEYSLDGISYQASPVFAGLLPGNYSVTLKIRSNGCELTSSGLIINPEAIAPDIPVASVIVQPDCLLTTGTIKVTAPTGSNYEYTLDGFTYQSDPVFENLIPSAYSLKVRETSTGCESEALVLKVNAVPEIQEELIAQVSVQPNCLLHSGTIEVISPLGVEYEYSLDGITYQKSTVFASLDPGNYDLNCIVSSNKCELTSLRLTVLPIPQIPDVPVARVTYQPDCLSSSGTIEVFAPIGTEYEYSLNGISYQNSPVFAGLVPGKYSVKVKFITSGCELTSSDLIINTVPVPPNVPTIRVIAQPDCSIQTGTIRVSAPLGTTYEYSIDGIIYQLNPVFTDLVSGDYSIKVREIITGCESDVSTVTINSAPSIPSAPVSLGNLTECAETPLQILDANTMIEPDSGINISWYDKPVGGKIVTLPVLNQPGTITWYAESNNSICKSLTRTPVTLSIYTIPKEPIARVTVHPTCSFPNGTVVVSSPVEGTGYEYNIDGGVYQSSATFTFLKWGEHLVRVKQTSSACESATAASVIVHAIPPAPVLSVSGIENANCNGGDGSLSFKVTNTKDGIYSIKYDGGEFLNVTVLGGKAQVIAHAGTYTNLSIDANGCTSEEILNATIIQPEPIIINELVIEIDLKSQHKGEIVLQVSGGAGTYSYKWSNGEITKDIQNLDDGSYWVIVTDQNGCTQEKTITIQIPDFPPVAIPDEFSIGCYTTINSLIINDYDPDGDLFYLDPVAIENPRYGSVFLNPDGTFEYLADPGFSGIDTFSYAIFDSKHYLGDTTTVILNIIADMDCDGIADDIDPDADGDGILTVHEGGILLDSDGDGIPNYLDIDSDNDGIVDHIEAQSSSGYIHPLEMDTDGDGIDDAWDQDQKGETIIPVDTDNDGTPDFLDPDSDNDLVPDRIEGHDLLGDGNADHIAFGKDSDLDGLDDIYDTVNRYLASGNSIGSNAPLQDFDGDGKPDWRDDNDDDDLYLTRFEDLNADGDFSNDDTDIDGHPEYLDYGRDCDLFIPNIFTPNNDNIHEYFQIYCFDHYPNAKIYLFDQLGNKIFEKEHYGNLEFWGTANRAWWSGKYQYKGNGNNDLVPVGTYFYVLNLGNGEVKKNCVFVSY